MFYHCEKLASINLSSFDTNKIENLSFMFADCLSITSLDLMHLKLLIYYI